MAIEKTNNVPHSHPNFSAYRTQKAEVSETNGGQQKSVGKTESDTVEISSEAKKRLEETNRPQGSDTQKLRDALVNSKVAHSSGQADRILNKVDEKMSLENNQQNERLELIKQRVKDNYYNSSEVFEKIATGLMKDMKMIE